MWQWTSTSGGRADTVDDVEDDDDSDEEEVQLPEVGELDNAEVMVAQVFMSTGDMSKEASSL
jgi:hypothetical protein